MTIKHSLFFWLLLFAVDALITGSSANAQVVNIESERLKADSNGVYGSLGGDFELTSNTKTVVVFDATANWNTSKTVTCTCCSETMDL